LFVSKRITCSAYKLALKLTKTVTVSDLELNGKFLFNPVCQWTEVNLACSNPRLCKQNQFWLAAETVPNTEQRRIAMKSLLKTTTEPAYNCTDKTTIAVKAVSMLV